MKLKKFNKLSFEDKYLKATEYGLFLYNYKTQEGTYDCYSFKDFYVEIIYNDLNIVIEFISYQAEENLKKFTGEKVIL